MRQKERGNLDQAKWLVAQSPECLAHAGTLSFEGTKVVREASQTHRVEPDDP
jgi:hypothetical protein